MPLALKDLFKQELDNMVSQGILSKLDDVNVNAPEWLNSFVVIKKPNGKLLICLDPTDLNPFIVRPVCNARTMEQIIALLEDAIHFAVFDSTKGFFHVPLDEASKMLTAMLTPVGIYIYNVLAMGLSNTTDIFESCIHQILEGLNGTINIADDVLVLGCDYDSFKSTVISFLDRCVEKDLHLNPDKIWINIPNMPFFGQVLTKEGLRPDTHKVDVIKQWPTPTNVTELQSFLGSVNYLCKFIPYLSDLRQPLQGLLKSDSELLWTQVHDKAFKNLKQAICKDIALQFFDSDLPLYIETDASQKGIGAVMLQPDKKCKNTSITGIPNNLRPVAYAYETLTSCKNNYSNIERELLGVLFSVLHFKHFTFGCKVHIITDHKPLVSLLRKSLTSAFPRLSICKDIALQFFDSDLPLYIETDASQKGIGAVMLQPDKKCKNTSITGIPNNLRPVAYAYETLTSCKNNYSNIERELLGVLFSVLHFKHFTFGCKVHIITDHKPLVSLLRKSLTSAFPRLSRMLLHILDYQLDVMYQPGTKMHLSDVLSRLTSHNNNSKAEPIKGLDVTVHDVQIFTKISPLSLAKIKHVTENDPDLKSLRQYIQDGFPANRSDCAESVQAYFGFREELAIVNGLIVKGHQVVIPNQLHDEALKLLHSSPMGIVKMKDRARTSFFWSSIDRDIESHLSECHPCATFQEKQPKETLLNDPISTNPWYALAMDNFVFNSKHYLIVVNCFSKFVVVEPSKDLTSMTTINSLLDIFSEHGFPATIRCDQGCNFV